MPPDRFILPGKPIDGSVGEVTKKEVAVHCLIDGRRVKLLLPRDMIPMDLLAYGQPIRILPEYMPGGEPDQLTIKINGRLVPNNVGN